MIGRSVDIFGMASGGTVTSAVVRGAEERASFEDFTGFSH
jgi:hypothetical protein